MTCLEVIVSPFENSKEAWSSMFLLAVPNNKYYPTYGLPLYTFISFYKENCNIVKCFGLIFLIHKVLRCNVIII